MSEKLKNSAGQSRWSILGLLFAWLLLTICFLCLGINVDLSDARVEYLFAREKWEAHNLSDYEMRVQFLGLYMADVSMTIENNQIVSMDLGSPLDDDYLSFTPIDLSQDPSWYTGINSYGSFLPPSLQDYEVSRMFEFTEESILSLMRYDFVSLCSSDLRYELVFNEEYGYVEEMLSTNCPSWNVGGGLLCPIYGHCEAGFRVVEFVP